MLILEEQAATRMHDNKPLFQIDNLLDLKAKGVCTQRTVEAAQMRPENAIGLQFRFEWPSTILEIATFCLSVRFRASQSIASLFRFPLL